MRCLFGLLVCLFLAGSAPARIIAVDDDGPADYFTIQEAINDSNDGDTIEVRPGTYRGPWNRDIDFLGKAITVRSINPQDANVVAATIVDCNGIEVQKRRAFIFASGEGGDSVLSGLTLTNGYAPGTDSYDYNFEGGAIYCENSSPAISYCVIRDSTARGYHARGSGVYCSNSQATFSHCIITG
ncbi:MAG: right-handed parallel beta-helix repeat-containing protein, partial [Planctomycetota bacterium]